MKSLLALVSLVGAVIDRSALYKWYEGINPKNVLYAVNCGSSEPFQDIGGITYMADRGFTDSVISGDGANKKWIVPNSKVYETERWSEHDFSYAIPLDI